jgi:hypothetical protein
MGPKFNFSNNLDIFEAPVIPAVDTPKLTAVDGATNPQDAEL